MRFGTVALLFVASLVAIPPTGAQDAAAPHLSPANQQLYAHHHDSDTTELNGWMNTHVVDPTGNDIALGPTAAGCCPQARVHAFTLAPALAGDVELDPNGNIVFEAYIGAGGSQGAVRVSTELRHGGALVASGSAQNHVYQQAGTAAYPKLTWTVAPEITSLKAGQDLVWTISITGVAVQTVFISVSPERGSTNIALPVLSTTAQETPAGQVHHEAITGAQAAFAIQATASNGTYHYSWPSPGGNLSLTLVDDAFVSGTARVEVVDAGNNTLANVTFSGQPRSEPVQGDAGNWTIRVQLEAYTGNLTGALVPLAPGSSGGGSTTTPSTAGGGSTSTGSGNTTSSSTTRSASKGTPGLPVVVLLAALAVQASLRRR